VLLSAHPYRAPPRLRPPPFARLHLRRGLGGPRKKPRFARGSGQPGRVWEILPQPARHQPTLLFFGNQVGGGAARIAAWSDSKWLGAGAGRRLRLSPGPIWGRNFSLREPRGKVAARGGQLPCVGKGDGESGGFGGPAGPVSPGGGERRCQESVSTVTTPPTFHAVPNPSGVLVCCERRSCPPPVVPG